MKKLILISVLSLFMANAIASETNFLQKSAQNEVLVHKQLIDHEENPDKTRFNPAECKQAARLVNAIVENPQQAAEWRTYMASGRLQPEYLAFWKRFMPKLGKLDPLPKPSQAGLWFLKECYERHGDPTEMFQGKELSPQEVEKLVNPGKPS